MSCLHSRQARPSGRVECLPSSTPLVAHRVISATSWLLLLFLLGGASNWALAAAELCDADRARRAAARVPCLQSQQLEAVLTYHNPALDEHLFRETLAAAAGVAACINDVRLFPTAPELGQDFHCLQEELLNYYGDLEPPDRKTPSLHYQDVLARASLRFHYSLLDTDLSIPEALRLVEDSLRGYQSVFLAAAQIHKDPGSQESRELAEQLGFKLQSPIPEFPYLEEFVEMTIVNARRFPRALGRHLGEALGPVLCETHRLYPQHRTRIAHWYNLLIRFDLGNMAAPGQLDLYLQRLEDFFRPAPPVATYLMLQPADWAPTPQPCGEQSWMLIFPQLQVRPGFRMPRAEELRQHLEEMGQLLLRAAELAENRNHLWKPFLRHAELLWRIAQGLRVGAGRNAETRRMRQVLMEKVRDTLVLRGVEATKRPLDAGALHKAIDEQIDQYGNELLHHLQLDTSILFAEGYLEVGETFLTAAQAQRLHRQLAVAYTLREDPAQALAHRQKSDLKPGQLEELRSHLRQFGVGVKVQREEEKPPVP